MSGNAGVGGNGLIVPADFEATPEENSLLALYGKVRLYEKERDKIKEQAAKDKLRAKDEQFRRENEGMNNRAEDDTFPSSSKKKRARSNSGAAGDEMDYDAATGQDSDDDSEVDSGDDRDEENSVDHAEYKARRRQEKLKKLRQSVEEEKERGKVKQKALEEQERQLHLMDGGNVLMDDGLPVLKKKAPQYGSISESLLSSVQAQSTPPHEFSKKLALPRIGHYGRQIFPISSDNTTPSTWTPPQTATGPSDGDLHMDLLEFDLSQVQHGEGKNTIAIKFTAPEDSNRFSINICEKDHNNFSNILFHFNPRQRQKGGQLVINDKQDGIWGQGINVPLSILPLIFGQTACALILQINNEGFDVFLDGKHCARLEHRRQLTQKKRSLLLQLPSTDDYGSPENWEVYKIWWGHKKSMAGDLSNVPGVNVSSYQHPKKLFVSNLTKIYSEPEVELRRAELERAFRKYGGAQGCIVKVPTNSTFAFVEVETSRMADLALREMQHSYTMSRARRTRAEMLQEQREAEGKQKEESNEWD